MSYPISSLSLEPEMKGQGLSLLATCRCDPSPLVFLFSLPESLGSTFSSVAYGLTFYFSSPSFLFTLIVTFIIFPS